MIPMPKYTATVEYHVKYVKDLNIYADDIDLAEEKATELVEGWNGVVDATVLTIETEE